ncbi:hypothetical protein CEXT_441801 [Caerostris extrusa]|uniref:C2H2-type domain-containing protein n=1 Tax=Caerostris extrusa TaxID=172846 RepID=A0AAV4VJZ1_CAEEX|nr:hypothetical protein CEXT_441801 [Caerostris extrusa]
MSVLHCIHPHWGDRPYRCPECGQCFAPQFYTAQSVASTLGDRPYRCPECGQCFAHSSSLQTRPHIHTGDRPYRCPECGQCFAHSSSLRRHVRSIHTLEIDHIDVLNVVNALLTVLHCADTSVASTLGIDHIDVLNVVNALLTVLHCADTSVASTLGIDHIDVLNDSQFYTVRSIHTGDRPYRCPECGLCSQFFTAQTRPQHPHWR